MNSKIAKLVIDDLFKNEEVKDFCLNNKLSTDDILKYIRII